MSIELPPESTEKIMKARFVFGDSILDDEELSSLNYSPSPSVTIATPFKHIQNTTRSCNSFEVVSSQGQQLAVEINDNHVVGKENAVVSFQSPPTKNKSSNLREEVCRLRMKQRTPLKRDLIKKTQDAIKAASQSVNDTLNTSIKAVRKAKDTSFNEKLKETVAFRQNWKRDIVEAETFTQMAHQTRLRALMLERQLSSQMSKAKAKDYTSQRNLLLKQIEQETNFQSQVYREHKKALHDEREKRRRQSLEARAKQRAAYRVGTEKMRMQSIAEDQAIIVERHEASIALRNAQKEKADLRRKSYVFRTGDAKRIRDLYSKLEAEQLKNRHESFELDLEAGRDARKYQEQLALERRESLSNRNKAAYEASERMKQQNMNKLLEEQASFELKRKAEKDVEKYLADTKAQIRQDLMQQNKEYRKQREKLTMLEAEAKATEHTSFELKWAGEKDAEEYRNKLNEEHRQSLKNRNDEHARHAKVMQELQGIASEMEKESYALKWAGEKDAEDYLRKLAEERRLSLQLRGKIFRQHRRIEQEEHDRDVAAMHQDEEMKSLDQRNVELYRRACADEYRQHLQECGKQKMLSREVEQAQHNEELKNINQDVELRQAGREDAQAYMKKCAERDRLSLEYRRKEAHKQRLEAQNQAFQQKTLDHTNFQLETEARFDVQDYLNECKTRRRMSLALRAKERRNHANWQREQSKRELDEQSDLVRGRMLDRMYVEIAQQQERAEATLKKLQNPHYSFNSFSNIH